MVIIGGERKINLGISSVGEVFTQYFTFAESKKFELSSGQKIGPITVAFETYGKLNEKKNNAILIFHALSGSPHAAGYNPGRKQRFWTEENYIGWWESYIGPGKIFDTNKYFIICANCLGGCYGTTGPSSINSRIKKYFAGKFPVITIKDMVNVNKKLIEYLEINKLHAVVGGSMGGLEALEWVILYPESVKNAVLIASSAKTSTANKILNFEQIFAIEEDPHFKKGEYYGLTKPTKGLQLARMIAHKKYVDIETLENRSRGEIVQREGDLKMYRLKHKIESYMLHQGKKFVKRFDANTYLKILEAMQTFDVWKSYGNGSVTQALVSLKKNPEINIMVVGISSDVCYYPEEQKEIVDALHENGIKNKYVIVQSEKGHDSFLTEPEKYEFIKEFLE